MARQQGAQSQLAVAFESNYGVSPASGFSRMPFASTTIGAAQPLLANELLGYGRDPLAPQRDAITVDGEIVVPIDVNSFGFWLKGAFGNPASSGTGTVQHVFTSGAEVLPSLSIEVQQPRVPYFAMSKGAMVNMLSWTMQRSGLLTARVGLIAQDEISGEASAAGTLEDIEIKRFGHFNGSIRRNGAVLGNVVSAEITYSNNLDPVEVIRGDGLIGGADPSIAQLSGRITVRFDNRILMDQARDGEPCAFEFGYELTTGESLTVSVPAAHLPRAKAPVEGPAGVQVSFDWQASQTLGGDPMIQVRLVNERVSY
ncbi:phage tail tube protein [Cereibacter sp. SYSU M97828]|nr:phage tail tube protein [Cereibacter flavus]